jgi:hypothetical protein
VLGKQISTTWQSILAMALHRLATPCVYLDTTLPKESDLPTIEHEESLAGPAVVGEQKF